MYKTIIGLIQYIKFYFKTRARKKQIKKQDPYIYR